MKEISDSDRWNPAHFGEMPRKLDSAGNPLIFWDHRIEPPEPDDYDTLAEYEEAWHKWEKEYSDSLTCAAELEWKRTTSWEHQIRSQSPEIRLNRQERSIQSRVARTTVRAANRLDIATGTPSGNRITALVEQPLEIV